MLFASLFIGMVDARENVIENGKEVMMQVDTEADTIAIFSSFC